MKFHKKLLVMALTGISAGAFAQYSSPELVMVADAGGTLANGTQVQAQVERYDPTTGAYLGAFGAGYLHDPTGIMVVGQDAYVTDTWTVSNVYYSKIDKFNFSTGAYDGSIFSASPYYLDGLAGYNGSTLASDLGDPNSSQFGTGLYTYNSSGQQIGFTGAPSNFIALNVATGDNQAYVTGYGGVIAYSLNSDGTVNSNVWSAGSGSDYYGVAASQYQPGLFYAAGLNSSGGVIDEYNSSGGLVQEYLESTAAYDGLAFGHNGVMYALNDASDSIERFDTLTGIEFGSMGDFSLSDTANAQRIAAYAAPEPFSMAGLAIGAIGLIARRRRVKA